MEPDKDGVLHIKNIEIELCKEEWSCLRLLFPKAVGAHTGYCVLSQGDIFLLRNQLSNISDSESKQFAKDLLVYVEKEDALQIHFTREAEPAPDHPPIE